MTDPITQERREEEWDSHKMYGGFEFAVALVRFLESTGQIKGPPVTEEEMRIYWDKLQKEKEKIGPH